MQHKKKMLTMKGGKDARLPFGTFKFEIAKKKIMFGNWCTDVKTMIKRNYIRLPRYPPATICWIFNAMHSEFIFMFVIPIHWIYPPLELNARRRVISFV